MIHSCLRYFLSGLLSLFAVGILAGNSYAAPQVGLGYVGFAPGEFLINTSGFNVSEFNNANARVNIPISIFQKGGLLDLSKVSEKPQVCLNPAFIHHGSFSDPTFLSDPGQVYLKLIDHRKSDDAVILEYGYVYNGQPRAGVTKEDVFFTIKFSDRVDCYTMADIFGDQLGIPTGGGTWGMTPLPPPTGGGEWGIAPPEANPPGADQPPSGEGGAVDPGSLNSFADGSDEQFEAGGCTLALGTHGSILRFGLVFLVLLPLAAFYLNRVTRKARI